MQLSYKSIEPSNTATACVIWLHGLGATADDFMPIIPQLKLPEELAVRFIFPQANILPVSLNRGFEMPAWFDIYGIALKSRQDEVGIRASETDLLELINAQIEQGILSERIVLAGFSQGGARVLHTALRFPHKLAGAMVLSSYLPIAEFLAEEKSSANQALPIFVAHGECDDVIPMSTAELTCEALQTEQYQLETHFYPMAHEVCGQEIADISAWLQRVLH
jgi:phospholipase/carboxylesterase